MAQPDYRLLDTSIPAKIGPSIMQGMEQVNALRSQNLQNQAAEFEIKNALAEQEAFKQAAREGNVQQALMERGLGKQAAAYGKTTAEAQKLGLEGQYKKVELQRARMGQLAADPSDQNVMATLQQQLQTGEITPDQAQQAWGQVQMMNPQQRREYFTRMGVSLDTLYKTETLSAHDREQLAISRGHLTLAQQREARLAAGQTGTTLTPEQNEALFGENGAVTRGLIDPMKINSRNAKMWADAYTRNPNANVAQISQDVKAAEGVVKAFASGVEGRKVTAFNTAIDHLDTLEQLGAALKNNDVRLFNELSNRLGAATGQAAPTSFAQASKIVGGEISKAIVPGVGTGKEREEAAHAFNTANSPEQLAGAIATSKKLMGGQLKSLEHQYQRGTKRTDFADTMLTPAARKAYQSAGATAPATARPAGVGADWQLMTDASGNKAWVSPDKKSFKEVK